MSAPTDIARRAESLASRPRSFLVTVVAGAVAITVLAILGFHLIYGSRIYPGIKVRGVEIGGQTQEEARATLRGVLGPADRRPLSVGVGSVRWELPRTALGGTDDVDALVSLAYGFGRSGPFVTQVSAPIGSMLSPRDLAPTRRVGVIDWSTVLAPIIAKVDRPAVDATVSISADHRVVIRPEASGVQLDREAAKQLISTAVVAETSAPIELPMLTNSPTIGSKDLEPVRGQLQGVLNAPIDLAYDGKHYTFSIDQIQAAVIIPTPSAGKSPPVQIDPSAVAGFVDAIASAVDRSAKDATIAIDGDKVVIRPGQTSRLVNRPATVERMNSAFFVDQRSVPIVVDESRPTVDVGDLTDIADRANKIIGTGLILQGPEQKVWKLAPADLRQMLVLPTQPGTAADNRPHLDQTKLTALVGRIAASIDTSPANARFGKATAGDFQVIRSAVPGRRLIQDAAIASVVKASETDSRTLALPIESIVPKVTDGEVAAMAGLQLVAENTTSYVGSIPPRRHNVELATSLLNGVVVPPGEVFSFNREMGPTTLDRGFQVGYGIEAHGDSVKTVPSVAGGICQVATTLFQPVFWTGYSIEERYSHLYWIAHYASRGVVGLDTTVDDESGLDFQFKNDTSRNLLIQTSTDGSSVHFTLYGVPPTWKVQVDKPAISNLVKADRTTVLQPDPTLPKGQRITSEAAEDGFNVVVRRIVTSVDGATRQLDLKSNYIPSHNVILVGTKT